jgi:HTH-type transcriptional regulator, competence development regulator
MLQIGMVDEAGFGARVRLLRHEKGLTLRELAKRVDLDFSYLSKIENDKLPPPADATIVRLSKTLDVDPDQLFSIARKVPTDLRQRVREAPPQTAFLMRKLSTSQLSDEQYRQIMEILTDASHD